MKCQKCNFDLVPGYAIYTRSYENRLGLPPVTLKAENVEIVFIAKCSICGHNEELTLEEQSELQNVVPPGYENWNAYWAAGKKELPRKWFRSILEKATHSYQKRQKGNIS